MDTKNQVQQIQSDSALSASQVSGNQASQSTMQAGMQQQTSPVSLGNKEHGPISMGRVSEFVAPHPAEAAPQIPQEVKAAGVEMSPNVEQPGIPEEVRHAGITHAKESVPVTVHDAQTAPQSVHLPTPMNYEEAKREITHGNPNNSKTWLGMLSKYVLEKFGMQKAV